MPAFPKPTATETDPVASPTAAAALSLADTKVPKSLIDAKGDMIVGSADDTPIRKAVGSDGQVLTADAASGGGVKWATMDLASLVTLSPATAARNTIQPSADVVPLTVTAKASQTANLTEWKNSAGGLAGRIDSSGGNLYLQTAVFAGFYQATIATGAYIETNASGGISVLNRTTVSNVVLTVKGMASQTGNLQEWQSSAAAVYSTISENGYFTTRKVAAPADAELATSEVAFWFDDTSGAAKLKIKGKDSGGVVRTGEVALT